MNLQKIIKELEFQKPHPVIFVSGFLGSGKTTFAQKLAKNYHGKYFELDWYLIHSSKERSLRMKKALESKDSQLIDRELNPFNHYDWAFFRRDLMKLQKGKKLVIKNAWNQTTGEKDSKQLLDFKGRNGIIVCAGDYLLHQKNRCDAPNREIVTEVTLNTLLEKESW